MRDLALALDIGTSSTRAILFSSDAVAIEGMRAQSDYTWRADSQGMAEFDPDLLLGHIAGCLDELLHKAGSLANRIACVGVCTFWHSMLGLDAHGRAVTPLYTWADTRPGHAARRLSSKLNADAVHARTGCVIHSSYFPARLYWLQSDYPQLYRQVKRWVSPGEYLFHRLFGNAICSISMASATGLFDQNRCSWDAPLLKSLGLDADCLSPVDPTDPPAAGLLPEWSSRWPPLAEIPWIPAIGDGASSNLGSGCMTEERMAINLGTSGAIRVLWQADQAQIPPELWCYRLDRERFVMGAAFSDGGSVYSWMARTLSLPAKEEIEESLQGRQPGEHGMIFLPFLSGERSFGWRPEAAATLHGMRWSTTALDILQAAMEGVALRFALAAHLLRRQFPQTREIAASGNALTSPVWAKMLADAIGQPVRLLQETEASSRGSALLALKAAGLLKSLSDAPSPNGILLYPDDQRHAIYLSLLEKQQSLYNRVNAEDPYNVP
jgi:gluconokinase